MFFKFILSITITSVFCFAIQENKIQQTTDIKVREVLNILRNNSLNQSQKDKLTVKIIDDIFDFKIMGQISLGKKWNSLSRVQKVKFSNAFENKIKHSYLDKLKLYNNQKVNIMQLKKVKANRISLETQVIGVDDIYKVVYLFYKKSGTNEWYVYDVELVGVSIVQTYRKQFSEFLVNNNINELIKTL